MTSIHRRGKISFIKMRVMSFWRKAVHMYLKIHPIRFQLHAIVLMKLEDILPLTYLKFSVHYNS